MAQIPFDANMRQETQSGDLPSYFSLKNNGDFALVRFMYNSSSDFEIFETHSVPTKSSSYGRTVSCLRDPHDPLHACPFCSAGMDIKQKFFVKMLVYTSNADGTVTAERKIWEKTKSFAFELHNKQEKYGIPLYQHLFIITKNVINPADKKSTRYSIDYAPEITYPATRYPVIPNAFDDYKVYGGALYVPSEEDVTRYFTTGDFKKPRMDAEYTQPMQTQQSMVDSVLKYTQQNPVVPEPAPYFVPQRTQPPVPTDPIPYGSSVANTQFAQPAKPTAPQMVQNASNSTYYTPQYAQAAYTAPAPNMEAEDDLPFERAPANFPQFSGASIQRPVRS